MSSITLPPHVRRALGEASDRSGAELHIHRLANTRFAYIASGGGTFAYIAANEGGSWRLRREARLLEWAASQSVPVPRLVYLEPDGSFLIVERVPVDPAQGREYVEAAVRAADSIAVASLPPDDLLEGAPRRAPRLRSAPLRYVRLLRGPFDIREVIRVQSAIRSLPATALQHGDFAGRNVLFDQAAGSVRVVDWEYVGRAPRHIDLATMWSFFERAEDRQTLLDILLDRVPERERPTLGLLLRWASLRFLLELLTWSPRATWDMPRAEKGLVVLEEARRLHESWS